MYEQNFLNSIRDYLDPMTARNKRVLSDAVSYFSEASKGNTYLFQLAISRLHHFLNRMTSRELSVESRIEFIRMYLTYLIGETRPVDLRKVKAMDEAEVLMKTSLPDSYADIGRQNLSHVAVLKVNGGLGTTMGCDHAKSLINIRDNDTFLSIISKQVSEINTTFDVSVPLILMNSFYTDKDTTSYLQGTTSYMSFIQNEFPRIKTQDQGVFAHPTSPSSEWAPPGHGDLYTSLFTSGIAETLIEQGITTLFISNADNLAAQLDLHLYGYMVRHNIDFFMEVTRKTEADKKGGILVKDNERVTLLERAQVASDQLVDFEDIHTHKFFNTNNVWVNLPALIKLRDENRLQLPIISNKKEVHNTSVVQLESALGAAIQCFENSKLVCVDRDRFLPVKTCNDLLLLMSDVYDFSAKGEVSLSNKQQPHIPVVKLGPMFQQLETFRRRFQSVPSLIECDSLELVGDIIIKENVSFKGTVKIIVEPGQQLVLQDKCVDNLSIYQDRHGNDNAVDSELA